MKNEIGYMGKRPQVLEADVVRFQNNKEKWIAIIGLFDGKPYEIFTGIADEEDGISIPYNITNGIIIRNYTDNKKHYDFQYTNKRGLKITIDCLANRFNKEYYNYAKLISGVLRYGMPIDQIIRLVQSLEFDDDSINQWKDGISKVLKKYDRENMLPE